LKAKRRQGFQRRLRHIACQSTGTNHMGIGHQTSNA
jgi:hypothetical protein